MLLQSLSNFALFAEDSQSLTGMTLRGTKLYTIDEAGRAEVGRCLDPEIADLTSQRDSAPVLSMVTVAFPVVTTMPSSVIFTLGALLSARVG